MLKLFRSVECDNQAMAQPELVAALCQAAKLQLPCFCIAEGCRNLNGLSYIEPLFDNKVTLPPKNYLEKKMRNDEIVNEARAIRDAHAAKFGYDLRAIYADLKKSEAERMAAGHPCIPAPERPVPSTALQRSRFAQR